MNLSEVEHTVVKDTSVLQTSKPKHLHFAEKASKPESSLKNIIKNIEQREEDQMQTGVANAQQRITGTAPNQGEGMFENGCRF